MWCKLCVLSWSSGYVNLSCHGSLEEARKMMVHLKLYIFKRNMLKNCSLMHCCSNKTNYYYQYHHHHYRNQSCRFYLVSIQRLAGQQGAGESQVGLSKILELEDRIDSLIETNDTLLENAVREWMNFLHLIRHYICAIIHLFIVPYHIYVFPFSCIFPFLLKDVTIPFKCTFASQPKLL